jgi:hypothetical protein
MLKLYCYADETGKDVNASFFLVSVAISEKDKIEKLRKQLLEIESLTKGKNKWKKTKHVNKIAFIERVVKIKGLKQDLFYSVYKNSSVYSSLVALSIGKAVIHKIKGVKKYSVNITIDGLNKTEREVVRNELKNLNIKYKKIKANLRDEQDVFLRLTDCCAGFIRDYLEKEKYALDLFKKYNLLKFFSKI